MNEWMNKCVHSNEVQRNAQLSYSIQSNMGQVDLTFVLLCSRCGTSLSAQYINDKLPSVISDKTSD